MLERLLLGARSDVRRRAGATILLSYLLTNGTRSVASKASAPAAAWARVHQLGNLPASPAQRTGLGAFWRSSTGSRTCKRWQTQSTKPPAVQPPGSTPSSTSSPLASTALRTASEGVLHASKAAAQGALLTGKAGVALVRTALNSSAGQAAAMQVDAFWERHARALYLGAAALAVYLIWRLTFKTAAIFVDITEGLAEWGFLAGAAALVTLAALYVKRHYTIDPDTVYRLAMLRLNTNPGVLEVMGAPLQGSPLRAFVQTGGHVYLKGMRPKLRTRRMQMMFPLEGPARKGLASLEVKKKAGAYHFKLLAVDMSTPRAAGGGERFFLAGDEQLYRRGAVLSELREPFLKALQQQSEPDSFSEEEDELDLIQDIAAFDGGAVMHALQRLVSPAAAARQAAAAAVASASPQGAAAAAAAGGDKTAAATAAAGGPRTAVGEAAAAPAAAPSKLELVAEGGSASTQAPASAAPAGAASAAPSGAGGEAAGTPGSSSSTDGAAGQGRSGWSALLWGKG